VVNSGGQESLTSSEQVFSYIQGKIKLKNTKKTIEIREGWGWLTGTTIIDCNCNVWKVG
jgi:hypothetical protein